MAGMSSAPTAATVPGPEPEMAAKNVQARMVTMASPPETLPTAAFIISTRSCVIPLRPMMAPASTKHGIAISVYWSTPEYRVCAKRFAVQDELYQWAYAQRDEDGQTYAETTYDEETKQHMSPQLAEKVWYRR